VKHDVSRATALAVALTTLCVCAPTASAVNYVPTTDGDSWGVQDAAAPATDTGSIRDTKALSLRGFGGIRVRVDGTDEPRFNGELMRGFGLRFDGYDSFRTTAPVDLGPVRISRAIHIDRTTNAGRWVDSFTNTSRTTITVETSFGGTLGQNAGNNQAAVAATSTGDTTITPADSWAEIATPTTAATSPTSGPSQNGPVGLVLGTPSPFAGAFSRTANALRNPFANPLATTGEEANFFGFLGTLTLAPGQTKALARFVVLGKAETAATAGTQIAAVQAKTAALAATPDLSGLTTGQICSLANWNVSTLSVAGFDPASCGSVTTGAASPAPTAAQPTTSSPYDVVDKTVTELQADMAAGRTTSQAITRAYLDRIAAYDLGPFGLHSYLYVNPDAMAEARAADAKRAAGATGPLLGIPTSLKDLYDTKDMATTAGTLVLEGYQPPEDAPQVARLRAAGAVFLGKANLAELATGASGSASGWGTTWNAFQPSKAPMGSSGGSAVSVAASLTAFSMGTQSGGSLFAPGTAASLYTMRTSDGMASVSGVYPLFFLQDNAGPMVRSADDLATVLNVTTGTVAGDPETAAADAHRPADWRTALDEHALEGKRIGYYPAAFNGANGETGTRDAMLAQLDTLRAAGAEVVTLPNPPALPAQPVSTDQDYVEGFYRWVDTHPNSPIHTVADLRESSRILPYNYRTDRSNLPRMTATQVQAFRDWRIAEQTVLTQWMDDNHVDAVVYPGLTSDVYDADANEANPPGVSPIPSSSTGLPSMIVPVGANDHGQPVSLQLLGRRWSDPQLLGYAYAMERQHEGHLVPSTTPALSYAPGVPSPPVVVPPPVAPVTTGGSSTSADASTSSETTTSEAPSATPAPVPPTTPATAKVAVGVTVARKAAHGRITVTLHNRGTAALTGRVTLRATVSGHVVTLGTATIAVRADATRAVAVTLRPRALALLRRDGRLRVVATTTVLGGNATVTVKTAVRVTRG
jgi:amidase